MQDGGAPGLDDTEDADLDSRWHDAFIPKKLWHFHRQLLARYGLVLRPGECEGIARAIRRQTPDAMLIEKRKYGGIYCVRIPGTKTHIFVREIGRNLVTAWPPSGKMRRKRSELLGADEIEDDKMPGDVGTPYDFDESTLPNTHIQSAGSGEILRICWRVVRRRDGSA
ncbi:hypothetical protein STAQ_41760 [Allostella sp. ATCC 35155]|nr:hypothetical protein STAQ_41760 [Stella sp. ATCC 35155]